MFLPRSIERAVVEREPPHDGAVPHGRETVLVVEDNELVLDFTIGTLKELGYRVLHAVDGASALELLDREEVGIDLLFTDVVMPNNMTGMDLAVRARSMNPGLKILLTSGHMPDAMRETARRSDFEYISKPYDPDELARRLRSVLAS
jgi:CheY-like chemotaxis protein